MAGNLAKRGIRAESKVLLLMGNCVEFLYAFFGMFVGTVQAFVFTMLTITYIAVATK